MSRKKFAALSLAIIVSGCATNGAGSADSFCAAAKPIILTTAEIEMLSDESIEMVLAHNEFGESHCNW